MFRKLGVALLLVTVSMAGHAVAHPGHALAGHSGPGSGGGGLYCINFDGSRLYMTDPNEDKSEAVGIACYGD